MRDSKERFSDRVEDYVKYRPSYPPEIVDELRAHCRLDGAEVADIGSGPGNLSRLLIPYADFVYGVEPNPEMRAAGETVMVDSGKFASVAGSAEQTTLEDASVDLVTAGQAYHWFDPAEAHREFARILRPGGQVALVWNSRVSDSTPFLVGYEQLLRELVPEYVETNHRNVPRHSFDALFGSEGGTTREFDYEQRLDWPGLRGRALSSSYVPTGGEAGERFLDGLQRLFDAEQTNGTVSFLYKSEIHYGTVSPSA